MDKKGIPRFLTFNVVFFKNADQFKKYFYILD